jgi:thiamine biosynthesis lipoprotein ApbE
MIAAATLFCATCRAAAPVGEEQSREEQSIDAMGSLISVVAYGESAERVHTAVSQALDEASRLDAMLSNYKPLSEWSEMNRLAGDHAVHVSDELFGLLEACLEYSRESEGTFDISVGPLMRVWGFYKGSGHMARPEELSKAMQFVGYHNVVLDARENYKYPESTNLMRPDVGTQAQFKKKKPPATYRYDSSLSPTLEWDV